MQKHVEDEQRKMYNLISGMESKVAFVLVAVVAALLLIVFLVFPIIVLSMFVFSLDRHARCFVHRLSDKPGRVVVFDRRYKYRKV